MKQKKYKDNNAISMGQLVMQEQRPYPMPRVASNLEFMGHLGSESNQSKDEEKYETGLGSVVEEFKGGQSDQKKYQKPPRSLFKFDKHKKVTTTQNVDKILNTQSSEEKAVTAVHHAKPPNAKKKVIPFQAIQVQEETKIGEVEEVKQRDNTPLTAMP